MTVSSRPVLPSLLSRRVGVQHFTFEARSRFTRVTARRIARLPKATLVMKLQYAQLPAHTTRNLPDLPSFIWVEPSSTGISRHRDALNNAGSGIGIRTRCQIRLPFPLNREYKDCILDAILSKVNDLDFFKEAFPNSDRLVGSIINSPNARAKLCGSPRGTK
jgi:hypothetical protein